MGVLGCMAPTMLLPITLPTTLPTTMLLPITLPPVRHAAMPTMGYVMSRTTVMLALMDQIVQLDHHLHPPLTAALPPDARPFPGSTTATATLHATTRPVNGTVATAEAQPPPTLLLTLVAVKLETRLLQRLHQETTTTTTPKILEGLRVVRLA